MPRPPTSPLTPATDGTPAGEFAPHRGFTGHEMLDEFSLVHMNGRVYDPLLGRFLSADPIVADATDTQSHNRYAYLTNGPLNATDPTGHYKEAPPPQGAGILHAIAAIVLAVVLMPPWALPALLGPFGAAVATGAIAGFVGSGFTWQGAFWGALSAAVFYGTGHGFKWGDKMTFWEKARKYAAHGVAGGALTSAQGGSFKSGFASAWFSAAASNCLEVRFPEMDDLSRTAEAGFGQ